MDWFIAIVVVLIIITYWFITIVVVLIIYDLYEKRRRREQLTKQPVACSACTCSQETETWTPAREAEEGNQSSILCYQENDAVRNDTVSRKRNTEPLENVSVQTRVQRESSSRECHYANSSAKTMDDFSEFVNEDQITSCGHKNVSVQTLESQELAESDMYENGSVQSRSTERTELREGEKDSDICLYEDASVQTTGEHSAKVDRKSVAFSQVCSGTNTNECVTNETEEEVLITQDVDEEFTEAQYSTDNELTSISSHAYDNQYQRKCRKGPRYVDVDLSSDFVNESPDEPREVSNVTEDVGINADSPIEEKDVINISVDDVRDDYPSEENAVALKHHVGITADSPGEDNNSAQKPDVREVADVPDEQNEVAGKPDVSAIAKDSGKIENVTDKPDMGVFSGESRKDEVLSLKSDVGITAGDSRDDIILAHQSDVGVSACSPEENGVTHKSDVNIIADDHGEENDVTDKQDVFVTADDFREKIDVAFNPDDSIIVDEPEEVNDITNNQHLSIIADVPRGENDVAEISDNGIIADDFGEKTDVEHGRDVGVNAGDPRDDHVFVAHNPYVSCIADDPDEENEAADKPGVGVIAKDSGKGTDVTDKPDMGYLNFAGKSREDQVLSHKSDVGITDDDYRKDKILAHQLDVGLTYSILEENDVTHKSFEDIVTDDHTEENDVTDKQDVFVTADDFREKNDVAFNPDDSIIADETRKVNDVTNEQHVSINVDVPREENDEADIPDNDIIADECGEKSDVEHGQDVGAIPDADDPGGDNVVAKKPDVGINADDPGEENDVAHNPYVSCIADDPDEENEVADKLDVGVIAKDSGKGTDITDKPDMGVFADPGNENNEAHTWDVDVLADDPGEDKIVADNVGGLSIEKDVTNLLTMEALADDPEQETGQEHMSVSAGSGEDNLTEQKVGRNISALDTVVDVEDERGHETIVTSIVESPPDLQAETPYDKARQDTVTCLHDTNTTFVNSENVACFYDDELQGCKDPNQKHASDTMLESGYESGNWHYQEEHDIMAEEEETSEVDENGIVGNLGVSLRPSACKESHKQPDYMPKMKDPYPEREKHFSFELKNIQGKKAAVNDTTEDEEMSGDETEGPDCESEGDETYVKVSNEVEGHDCESKDEDNLEQVLQVVEVRGELDANCTILIETDGESLSVSGSSGGSAGEEVTQVQCSSVSVQSSGKLATVNYTDLETGTEMMDIVVPSKETPKKVYHTDGDFTIQVGENTTFKRHSRTISLRSCQDVHSVIIADTGGTTTEDMPPQLNKLCTSMTLQRATLVDGSRSGEAVSHQECSDVTDETEKKVDIDVTDNENVCLNACIKFTVLPKCILLQKLEINECTCCNCCCLLGFHQLNGKMNEFDSMVLREGITYTCNEQCSFCQSLQQKAGQVIGVDNRELQNGIEASVKVDRCIDRIAGVLNRILCNESIEALTQLFRGIGVDTLDISEDKKVVGWCRDIALVTENFFSCRESICRELSSLLNKEAMVHGVSINSDDIDLMLQILPLY